MYIATGKASRVECKSEEEEQKKKEMWMKLLTFA